MNILAVDMATHTGYAIVENGKISESGEWDFTRADGEHYGHMFRKLADKLEGLFVLYRLDAIAYEVAHHRGGAATRITAGFNTVVLMFAAKHNLKLHSAHTASLKKWATGNGKAKKPDMMEFVNSKVNKEVIYDNEADAIIVGLHAYSKLREDPF